MYVVIQGSKLATIKSGNAVYAALLETPHGRQRDRMGSATVAPQPKPAATFRVRRNA